jgi:Protein of unknown function (DUF2851)
MPALAETGRQYSPSGRPSGAGTALLERDLWRIWEGQRFPRAALVTADGTLLRVIFRGRAGAGPGPDFRGAIITGPGGLLCGDVELHVRTSDFRRHGHSLDPAYAGVVLHVVFFHDEAGETALPGGGTAPVVALGGPQTERWLERPARWGEPCRSALERMGASGVGETLERLGAMRFRQKAASWRRRLAAGIGLEEALWAGLLEALAFGGDREAFRRLAEATRWGDLRPGLLTLPERLREPWAIGLLTESYEELGVPPARRPSRPGNRPERRLAGAAALAARFAGPGLSASLIGPLAEPDGAAKLLVAALTVPRLVGRARAIEIAGNAVLPLAAALCGEPAASRIEEVFAELPLPVRYGAVRHLHEVTRPDVRSNMRRQQGMLYLFHQYCTQGGCGKCPLS